MKPGEFVIDMLRLNGDPISHMRIQREAYLLLRGVGQLDEVAFIYVDGGPFSTELADALEMVCEEGRVREEIERNTSHRVYSHSKGGVGDGVDGLPREEASKRLGEMAKVTDIVLELAAAYVFIREEERYGDRTIDELMVRKPLVRGMVALKRR